MGTIRELDLLNNLENKIWITRKCRIEAESRNRRWKLFFTIALNWMSIITLLFSIIAIQLNNNDLDNYALIISIALVGITIITLSLDFSNKAKDYKNAYIEMDKILMNIKIIKLKVGNSTINSQEIIEEIEKIQYKYFEILDNTDNHLTIDFKQASRISSKKHGEENYNNQNTFFKYKKEHKPITRFIHFIRYYAPFIYLILLIVFSISLVLLFYTWG